MDFAGNIGTLVVGGINVDLTAPEVEFTSATTTFDVDDQVVVTCAASDALSGLDTSDGCVDIDVPAVEFAALMAGVDPDVYDGPLTGSFTIDAAATDVAGNTATTQITITIEATQSGLQGVLTSLIGPQQPGNGNGLHSKLTHDPPQYEQFISQVNAKCCTDQGNGNGNGKLFTRAEADLLIALAEELIANQN